MARKSRKHLYDIDESSAVPESERECFNAGAYVRISGDDKKKRGDSLETQRNIIENFAAVAPDITISEVYADDNITGTTFERPGFQRMLADAERGKINCIIVKDLTRFGRNAIDAGYYLEKYLPMLGIRFIAVTDAYDSAEDIGGILLPIKNIISEAYALDIGRKCRAVQHQNIADGRYVGRLAPYGYKKAPDDCHKLLIDEDTAPVVRQIFQWACEGVSANEIAKRLTVESVTTPSHYNHAKGFSSSAKLCGSAYWKASKVKGIISDKVYAGDMVQGRRRTVNNKQLNIDKRDWVCVPDTHDAIISREVFEQVQVIRQSVSDRAESIRQTSRSHMPSVFRGKVFCDKCGYVMKRKHQKKDDIYWYRCESQVKYSKDACTIVSVKEADLQSNILATLLKQSEAILGKYLCLVNDSESSDYFASELREINQNLDKHGRIARSLYESMVNGLVSKEEYVQMKADYEARIKALTEKADDIRNRQYELKSQATEYRDLAEAVSAIISNKTLTTDLIDRLVKEVRVHPDKSFNVVYRFRDEFTEVSGSE